MNARIDSLPPREAVLVEGAWRVAPAFNSSLAGWLVVVPTRHVTALDSLTPDEVAPLGHLHIHVVPRLSSFTPDVFSPRVFAFLSRPEAQWLSEGDQDGIAVAVRAALANVE